MGQSGKKWSQIDCRMDQNKGGNNREIIERVEKQQRDHFWHEAHKKLRKKTKGRDSTVYSTMRQTSLCAFISLKNNLY